MKFRPLPLLRIVALTLLFAACSSPQQVVEREERESPPYEVIVRSLGPAVVSKDGFDTRFEFEVISPIDLRRNSLVQELRQVITFEYDNGTTRQRELTLVEAFRLRLAYVDGSQRYHYWILPGQSDRHSMRGMNELPEEVVAVHIQRNVFAYVADVSGADFTDAGFAHLPRNQDGNVVSRIPERFNEEYQRKHDTRGMVLNSGDSLGMNYRISYRLVRTGGLNPQFVVDHGGGFGMLEAPPVVWVPTR
ncbi:MAG: hypothetical protein H6841_01410 [Planctomycetes bacterium]|nr:hypothetical protein [Planctomycetota bacterium]MCB9935588.1 hypothetical protein [Planctomycetota bacterium]